MNDNQRDIIKEIKVIAQLLQAMSKNAEIDGDALSHLGDILIKDCIMIES